MDELQADTMREALRTYAQHGFWPGTDVWVRP